MFLRWIAKLIIAINANTKPTQISFGVSFALILALIPSVNLLWAIILLIVFFIKVNLTVVLVFIGVFGALSPLVNGLLNNLGFVVGQIPVIYNFLSFINNIPIISFFALDNTLMIGGLLAGIILFIPVYLLSNLIINLYRSLIRDRIAKSKIIKKILMFPVVSKLARALRTAYNMYAGT